MMKRESKIKNNVKTEKILKRKAISIISTLTQAIIFSRLSNVQSKALGNERVNEFVYLEGWNKGLALM